MTTPCVIFDLDGTLANIEHRRHWVSHGKRDWDKFFAEMDKDIPNKNIVKLYNDLWGVSTTDGLYVLTGRPEKYRIQTEIWLETNVGRLPDAIIMRPDNDHRADHIVKKEMLDKLRADGYEPWLAIDDRQSIVDMWRANGITCLQCAPDFAEHNTDLAGKQLLTLMVGPSGAGKSTWLLGAYGDRYAPYVISSDTIRQELCGDFKDQSKNEQVFMAVHDIARTRLKHGLPVVIDATHLRRKDRMAAAALAPKDTVVKYVVINRPVAHKLADAGWRAGVPGLIEKHEQTFQSQLKDILAGDGLPNVVVENHIRTS